MPDSIFSTYSTGENRVTASIVAVLRSLSLSRIERLLGALLQDAELEVVRMQNQPSKGRAGVPDAEIASSFRVLIETKTKRGAVRAAQLQRHLERLDQTEEATRRLLVLTPDDVKPGEVEAIDDDRLVWASFANLDQGIEELLRDPREVVSEREAFLLRELQTMLAAEELVGSQKDVVVVPAKLAWPIYQRWHAYICQPGRTFQAVRHVAFYSDGEIKPVVPRILEAHDRVRFEPGQHRGLVGELVDRILADDQGRSRRGRENKILLLSAPEDARTLRLDAPIVNDLVSGAGRPTAFTQNQRYVSTEQLRSARSTKELA